jgi:hypothetical protein
VGASREVEIEFRQRYQELRGEARDAAGALPVSGARLEGDRIRFVIVDEAGRKSGASLDFDGRVAGNSMQGELKRGGGDAQPAVKWHAVRVGP